MQAATARLNRAEALLEEMTLTVVIIAQTQARRNRASVVAVIQTVDRRRVNSYSSTLAFVPMLMTLNRGEPHRHQKTAVLACILVLLTGAC